MRKRNSIIVLSLILASMIASGCGGSSQPAASSSTAAAASTASRTPSDGKEYLEALKEAFHVYANCSYQFSDDLEAKKFDAALKDIDSMDAALSDIESVTPPEQYADQQKKIIDSIKTEREYLTNCRTFIGYCQKGSDITEDDLKKVQELNKTIENAPTDFADTYIEVFRTVKADIDK